MNGNISIGCGGKRLAMVIIPIILAIAAFLAVTSMKMDSATFDEPVHIASGYLKLKYGEFSFYREQPPLLDTLAAIPLFFAKLNPDAKQLMTNQWDFGRYFLYHVVPDPDKTLFYARLPNLLFFLMLALLVGWWVYKITASPYAALFGVTLAGFCPNLLAHGRLITGDMGVTFFMTLSVFLFMRFIYNPRPVNSLLLGISTACALLAKVSGLILLPYFILLFVLYFFQERARFKGEAGTIMANVLLSVTAAIIFIEAFYLLEMSDSYIRSNYSHLVVNLWQRLAIPFMEYFNCVRAVFDWVHGSGKLVIEQFLLGRFSVDGWWNYYLVAFLLKTPVSTLLMLAISIVMCVLVSTGGGGASVAISREQRFQLTGVVLFILIFFAATLNNRINIGLRYLLPVYPFLYVFIAAVTCCYLQGNAKRRTLLWISCSLLLMTVVSSIGSYPSFLGYFNTTVRKGTEDRYLVDSNLDWGQDLARLAKWTEENHVPIVYTHYFGGGDPQHYLGARSVPFDPVQFPKKHGYYAVSRHLYRMSTNRAWSRVNLEEYFGSAEYITTIGSSILIFRI